MRSTKKLTLSAMAVALSSVFIILGAYADIFDLVFGTVASVILLFVKIELGSPYTWLVWLATTVCSALLSLANLMSVTWYFLIFGIYPILKPLFERIFKRLAFLPKIIYANAAFALSLLFFSFIFTSSPYAFENKLIAIAALATGNVAFIVYDVFLSVAAKLYIKKYRKLFHKLMK